MVCREGECGAATHGQPEDTVSVRVEAEPVTQRPAQVAGQEGFPFIGIRPAQPGRRTRGQPRTRIRRRPGGVTGATGTAEAEEIARRVPIRVETGTAADRHDHIDIPFGELTGDIGIDFPAAEIIAGAHPVQRVDHPAGVPVRGAEDTRFDRPHLRGFDPEIEPESGIETRRRRSVRTRDRHPHRQQYRQREQRRSFQPVAQPPPWVAGPLAAADNASHYSHPPSCDPSIAWSDAGSRLRAYRERTPAQ